MLALNLPPLVEDQCFSCHGGDKVEGGFDLTAPLSASKWQRAIAQVEREEMPPKSAPSPEERRAILDWLEATAAAAPPAPRSSVPRYARLTREEFSHSVKDLLGIDLRPGDLLEPDPQGVSGFTNDAESVQVSPAQAMRYLEAAERAVEGWLALERPGITVRWEAEALNRSSSHLKEFDHGMLFATEPQVISATIEIPVDGSYEIRCQGSTMGRATRLQVLDGADVVASIPITHPRPGATLHRIPLLLRKGWHTLSFQQPSLVPQASLPRDADRVMNERAARNRMQPPPLPPDASSSAQAARAALEEKCLYLQQAFEWLFAYGEKGDPRDIVRFRDYATERISGELEARHRYARDVLKVDVASFDREFEALNGPTLQSYRAHLAKISGIKWMDWTKYQGQLYLDWIEVAGPFAPPGRQPRSSRNLNPKSFAREAWRGQFTEADLTRYEAAGSLPAILASPRFVFRDNSDPSVRVSFFLTGGPPDPETLGTDWSQPESSLPTIRRLLASEEFVGSLDSFVGQWLGTASLGSTVMPDEYRFPAYKRHVAQAARQEPVEFLSRLVKERRPLLELLASEWTMADETMSHFYGLPQINQPGWKPVALPDRRRGGLLGMSAILASTSSPIRTTPVARGKWVWETLLGRPPGTPLPDAGVLPATAGEAGLTLRQELEAHRSDPRCTRCHEKLDPIGFSLENFDASGAWRDLVNGAAIDASGTFYHGEPFVGPEGLRRELLLRKSEFLDELVRKLLAFAHGRPCDDEIDWIREIANRVQAENWDTATLWEQVALNLAKHGPDAEPSPAETPRRSPP